MCCLEGTGEDAMAALVEPEAYKMMFAFLAQRYQRLPSDDLSSLLDELSLLPDGIPADPAVVQEWQTAVDAAKHGTV
jgi:hypothetical protein